MFMLAATPAVAADADPQELVRAAVQAAGGEGKLLKLFRMKERLNVSSDLQKKGNERTSVLEPPAHWWLGKNQRVDEPASYLVWAWTLGAITDPKSRLESIPGVTEDDRPLVGLRVSETITPPMNLYFDKAEHRLVRIDWRGSIHRFSEWKEIDGVKYAAKCIGYKANTGQPWYFTEILELERLTELPEGLQR
jgi:hypothetical protein